MHNSFKRSLLLSIALVSMAFPAMASGKKGAEKAAPTAVEQAEFAINLFLQSCLSHGGDKDGLRKWAKGGELPEIAGDEAKPFLENTPGGKGIVWSASGPQGGFVLVSEDTGGCSVYAHKADEKKIHERVKWVVENLEKNKGEQKISYETRVENDKTNKLRRTLVAIRRPEMANDVAMVATTSKENANLAAIISIFAIEKDAKL